MIPRLPPISRHPSDLTLGSIDDATKNSQHLPPRPLEQQEHGVVEQVKTQEGEAWLFGQWFVSRMVSCVQVGVCRKVVSSRPDVPNASLPMFVSFPVSDSITSSSVLVVRLRLNRRSLCDYNSGFLRHHLTQMAVRLIITIGPVLATRELPRTACRMIPGPPPLCTPLFARCTLARTSSPHGHFVTNGEFTEWSRSLVQRTANGEVVIVSQDGWRAIDLNRAVCAATSSCNTEEELITSC